MAESASRKMIFTPTARLCGQAIPRILTLNRAAGIWSRGSRSRLHLSNFDPTKGWSPAPF